METSHYKPLGNSLVNPFKALRLKQGISQYELARRLKISKHAVLRLEQGMYPNPLPTVVDYFVDVAKLNVSRPQLLEAYTEFQIRTREANARLLGDIPDVLTGCAVGVHPLTFLRLSQGLNATELAKRLCIAQNVVHYFEKRSIHQQTVPDQLIEALHDADYSEQETDALVNAYAKYRDWLRATKTLKVVN